MNLSPCDNMKYVVSVNKIKKKTHHIVQDFGNRYLSLETK